MSNCTADSIKTDTNCELPYFNAYDDYLKQMNIYCLESNNVISNSLCSDFIDNNQFIQNTDIQKNLRMQRTNACLSNTDASLNSTCLNLNIIPTTYVNSLSSGNMPASIPASNISTNNMPASIPASNTATNNMPASIPASIFEEYKTLFIILIIVCFCIAFGGIFYYYYKRKNNNITK